jgi:hypothetical protein
MQNLKQSSRYFSVICAGLALLFCSGCSTIPVVISTDNYTNAIAYEPVRSPVQIEASAAVDAVITLSAESQGGVWGRFGNNEASITNYRNAVTRTIRNDLATSGLFARIATDDATRVDYHVQARILESRPSDFRVSVTLSAMETASGAQVFSHTREVSLGTSLFTYLDKWKEALPGLMASLKADLAADLQAKIRQRQEQAAREEAELLTKASLSDLLAGSDKSVAFARARNRALIAAKNQQLPVILRDRKTDELSALVVKIEQTILDLNHEAEVAKDRAQQATANPEASSGVGRERGQPAAAAGSGPTVEELRDLSISYRERIELLKPIAAALKEEIANRSR